MFIILYLRLQILVICCLCLSAVIDRTSDHIGGFHWAVSPCHVDDRLSASELIHVSSFLLSAPRNTFGDARSMDRVKFNGFSSVLQPQSYVFRLF